MKKHYRNENNCLNCGSTLEGKFCHNCGQENLEIKESFGHMMNHIISDYFHFDHQFFHTLKPLFFKPGFLTNQYMAGKRVQYLHPVKMYIFISIVYFLLLFQSSNQTVAPNNVTNKPVTAGKIVDSISDSTDAPATKIVLQKVKGFNATTGDTTVKQYDDNQKKLPANKRDGFIIRIFKEKTRGYKEKYGSRANDVFKDELKHNIPKMMLLLLPVFALILSVTFWKSKKYYVEHLIYTIHLHCFVFLFLAILILVTMIIPGHSDRFIWWRNFLSAIYVIWYIYQSLRVVYHRSSFRTITKMFGISMMYLLSFSVAMALVFIVTALMLA